MAAPLFPFSATKPRLVVDLFGHLVWGYFALALCIFAVASGSRTRWLCFAAVVLSSSVIISAHRTSLPTATVSAPKAALRVITANVSVRNESPALLQRLIASRRPDVLFVQEVSPDWAALLEGLADYPYQKIIVRDDPFGIAVLSRHPLSNIRTDAELGAQQPIIAATMRWRGHDVDLVAVHPFPPLNKEAYAERNALLARHARALVAEGRPAIMAGDFNATPWSAGLAVVESAGLVRATTVMPTWPANLAVPAVIPIDHIAVSKHWARQGGERGPYIGSDHFPVEAALLLRDDN